MSTMFEIGSNLQEARARRCIDLVVAEEDTKIRSKYLAALEAEDFEVLPGAVFVRGFLRTYARYLGLDPQLYIDEYNARFGRFEEIDDQAALRPFTASSDRNRGAVGHTMRIVAVLSLVAIAVVIWIGLRDPKVNPADSSATPKATTAEHEAPAAADGDRAIVSPDAAVRSAAVDARHRATRRPAVPVMAQLTISTTNGASWVEVRRGSAAGEVVYAATMESGARKVVRGTRLYVTVGMPSVTHLSVGKQTVAGSGTTTTSYIVTPTSIRSAS